MKKGSSPKHSKLKLLDFDLEKTNDIDQKPKILDMQSSN